MQVFADRFLVDGDDTVDLATGERVRLFVEAARDRRTTQASARLCDQLAALRHPLLVPLVDYGVAHGRWFEAHTRVAPLRMTRSHARRTALHLGRFLRAAGVEMPRSAIERSVRPVQDAERSSQRPIGIHVMQRSSLDSIHAMLDAAGPPGVIRATICALPGAGLNTARAHLARAARLAGLLTLDRKLISLRGDRRERREIDAMCHNRHLCILDWLDGDRSTPAVLAAAAVDGARRHMWLHFCRNPLETRHVVTLERLTPAQLSGMVYFDAELGPTLDEVRTAAAGSDGLPGRFIRALSGANPSRPAAWVHETAPAYVARPAPPIHVIAPVVVPDAGVSRLERVVAAAGALAARGRHARAERLLRRASEALAARHAALAAAKTACDLGELQLDRCRPEAALEWFDRARTWSAETAVTVRSLAGSGRAMLDQGRLLEAEAALRTAVVAATGDRDGCNPRHLLAETLVIRGDLDAAREVLGLDRSGVSARELALASEIERRQGHLGVAGRLANSALTTAGSDDHVGTCEAHVASMHVQAVLRNTGEVERHSRAARAAARASRSPFLALRAAAESYASLKSCGVAPSPTRHARLLTAAARLPVLRGAQIRAAVAGIDADVRRVASRTGALSLVDEGPRTSTAVDVLETLLHITHEAADESAGLRAVAVHLLDKLQACSLTIRTAEPRRQVVAAGRPWPGDAAVAEYVLDAGAGVFRDGLAPEAAEPVRAGGSTIGCIAARWVTGTNAAPIRVTEWLRLAAAATAPLLRTFGAMVPQPPGPHADDLLGPGPAAESVRDAIRRAAMAPYPVLIEGESGAGKELVARAIHTRSARRARRFCPINCAALTDDLVEAELFGHSRGAFTGALVERAGLFEEADQGTLFLDEVGELSQRAQAKLLRVLQEGEVRRVGENHSRKVDARIVAATNRSIQAEVEAGRFRADLRFRVDVIRIRIPPLRERPDEVPWLAMTLWADAARRVGTQATLAPDLVAALARYDWPGNVRELQNVIASLAVHAPRRGRVVPSLLPPHVAGLAGRSVTSFDEARIEFERRFVRAALARAGGRRTMAARQLGISRQGLAKMMKRLGIENDEVPI
jgi:DNA-binding NtrC family response regulator/tetratricopeptide (TPR) repeat protein